jgi:DNA-binding LacI/PurR family transcriptional regulator
MENDRRITLKDIAKATGLSVAAVSKALRGLSDISPETRENVRSVAARMGYERDAALGALAAYRSKTRQQTSAWKAIAFLHNWPDFAELETFPYYRPLIESLRSGITRRGFSLEIHSVGETDETRHALLRRLKHRGVLGIVLGPLPPTDDPKPIHVDRRDFEVMSLGPSDIYPHHHTVQADYWQNFQWIWRELRARSYRRIGLYLPQNTIWRTGGAWLGGYLENQHQDRGVARIPPLLYGKEDSASFLAWYAKQKPDAIISVNTWPLYWFRLEGIAVPEDVGLVLTSIPNTTSTGIDSQPARLGESMAEMAEVLLHRRMIRIQHDTQATLRILVPGVWHEGQTLRPRPPASDRKTK